MLAAVVSSSLGCSGGGGGGGGGALPGPISPVSAALSTLTAAPAVAFANGTATVTLTATARDGAGAPVAGKAAVFTVSGTGNVLSAATAITDATGLAAVTLASTKAEAKTVAVAVDGVAVTQRPSVTFTTPPPQSASLSTVTPSGAIFPADGSTAATVTVTVRDGSGAVMAGQTVALAFSGTATILPASATTGAGGVATFQIVASVVTGGNVTATVNPGASQVLLSDQPWLSFIGSHTVGGTIAGLTANATGLVLSTPGAPDLTVGAGATSFVFPTPVRSGTVYSVSIVAEPAGLECGVVNPRGIVGTDDVATAAVWCAPGWATVSAGVEHTVGLKTDGTLWTWGNNGSGQLGDGSPTSYSRNVPVQIEPASRWKAVAAGERFTLAVKTDGTLWAWGDNGSGQLGDGTTSTSRTTPVQIGTATNWASVAAGQSHSMAIRSDGTLWGWGWSGNGAVGTGTTSNVPYYSPVQIGTATWASVAAGAGHTVAVKSDGTLWTWGDDGNGQLGDNKAVVSRSAPYQIGTATWVAVAAGAAHTVAVKSDGTLWAWGYNATGELGDGATTERDLPVQIGTGTTWRSVAAGASNTGGDTHTVAVKSDGTLWAWGYNSNGQLGDGTTTDRHSPVQIGMGFAVAATGHSHTAAVKTDGSLWTWGRNTSFGDVIGQLGDGTATDSHLPGQVGAGWASVATGAGHTVALKADGSLWGWGDNSYGQLGDGSTTRRPYRVKIGSGWAAVAVGSNHTVALRSDGTLWTWGDNSHGQLGDGSTTSRATPAKVGTDATWAAVAAGYYHTLALKSDGTLWAWGNNWNGQLGDGTYTERHAPVLVGSGYFPVAGGADHTVALKLDGTLWTWGDNNRGALGAPMLVVANRPIPARVGLGTTWSAVSAGYSSTFVLRADGALWAFGDNMYGQLGDGTQIDRESPVQVGTGYAWVAAGDQHVAAVKADASLWAWGFNYYGQLGGASAAPSVSSPLQLGTGWLSVAAGHGHNASVKSDGTLWTWGDNSTGQLGDGTTTWSTAKVPLGR